MKMFKVVIIEDMYSSPLLTLFFFFPQQVQLAMLAPPCATGGAECRGVPVLLLLPPHLLLPPLPPLLAT